MTTRCSVISGKVRKSGFSRSEFPRLFATDLRRVRPSLTTLHVYACFLCQLYSVYSWRRKVQARQGGRQVRQGGRIEKGNEIDASKPSTPITTHAYERGPSSCNIFCIPCNASQSVHISLVSGVDLISVMRCLRAFVMVPTDPRYHGPATSCRPAFTFPSESIDVRSPGAPFRRVLQTLYASAGCDQSRLLHLPFSSCPARFATPQLAPASRGYSPRAGAFLCVSVRAGPASSRGASSSRWQLSPASRSHVVTSLTKLW